MWPVVYEGGLEERLVGGYDGEKRSWRILFFVFWRSRFGGMEEEADFVL